MGGIAYHDYGYYSPHQPPPPPPQAVLFSNPPFPSPTEYDGYITGTESMGYFSDNRSLSEPFIHEPTESFGASSSASSSCNASLGPATPPLVPFKNPAVPITPGHVQPRQKVKRTATACEECRKRKQKCDGESPCQSCKEQKLDCRYREVSPTKKDNSMERLFALVESCSKTMEALNKRLDEMSSSVLKIEKRLSHCRRCGSSVELETGHCHSCNQISALL